MRHETEQCKFTDVNNCRIRESRKFRVLTESLGNVQTTQFTFIFAKILLVKLEIHSFFPLIWVSTFMHYFKL